MNYQSSQSDRSSYGDGAPTTNEDPVISLRYQSFMDELSSDESEEEEDELDASMELDMDYSDFDEDDPDDEYF